MRASAEGGRANAAVERVVAEALGVAASSARVVRGTTHARKVVEVDGVSETEATTRLVRLLGEPR